MDYYYIGQSTEASPVYHHFPLRYAPPVRADIEQGKSYAVIKYLY